MKHTPNDIPNADAKNGIDLTSRISVPKHEDLSTRIISSSKTMPQAHVDLANSGGTRRRSLPAFMSALSFRVAGGLACVSLVVVITINQANLNTSNQPLQVSHAAPQVNQTTLQDKQTTIAEPTVINHREQEMLDFEMSDGIASELELEQESEFVWNELMIMQDELLFAQL